MKTYNLAKEILVVPIDEFAYDPTIKITSDGKPNQLHYYVPEIFQSTNQRIIVLLEGNWQLLSIAKEMTEEKLEQYDLMPFKQMTQYVDQPINQYLDFEFNIYSLDTRLESFHSFMHSIGMPCVNPYGEKPEYNFNYYGKSPIEFSRFELGMEKWKEAEAKLVNSLILVKEE